MGKKGWKSDIHVLLLVLVGRVFAKAQETRVQSLVASYQRLKKWYLIPPCLTLSIIRYVSRVKWSNPREGVAPSSTPQCSSYWKNKPSARPRLQSPTLLTYSFSRRFLPYSQIRTNLTPYIWHTHKHTFMWETRSLHADRSVWMCP